MSKNIAASILALFLLTAILCQDFFYKLFIYRDIGLVIMTNDELEDLMLDSLRPVDVVGRQKVRSGPKGDGGYVLIAGLEYDGFYSYGVGDDIGFEINFLELRANRHLIAHCYDHTVEALPSKEIERLRFKKQGVGSEFTGPLNSIENQMAENGDGFLKNAFLKMDVEGGEWSSLFHISDNVLKRFKQITIEVHGLGNDQWLADMRTKVAVLRRLAKHFHLVHIHANNNAPLIQLSKAVIPEVLELTYLRKDKFFSTIPFRASYPIAGLDFKNNSSRPDIPSYPFREI